MNNPTRLSSSTSEPSEVVVLTAKQADFYKFLSIDIWGNLPASWQRLISQVYSKIYDQSFSKYLIEPYCKFHYNDVNYLDRFKPPFNKDSYQSFQDFFIRQFVELPKPVSETVWPCEGLLCDVDYVKNISHSNVKGDISYIHDIFGLREDQLDGNSVFSNVFLHNKNYHRIHSPVHGTISRIQHIKGDLVVLRPWIYKENPSIPAFRNERVNIDIIDKDDNTWHMSIVGGPAVGTIELMDYVKLGNTISILDEIALFYLGSTCCMVSPAMPKHHGLNSLVEVGFEF
jgi:phosphatidylserine decarboxylase